jgi:transporter family-2 protein
MTGLFTGIMMTAQGAINAALASRIGTYGSVLIVTLVNLIIVGFMIFIIPNAVSLQNLPGWNRWYLYLGGVLGVFILASINLLLPRFGTTLGFIYLISGQLVAAILIDHFGLFGLEKTPVDITKMVGIVMFISGAYLVTAQKLH